MPKIKEKPTLVEVESAIPLTPQQLETLQDRLKTLLKINQLQFDLKVKPKLISGISVKVGSVVIDASLKGMLAQFESELKQTAVQSMDAKKSPTNFKRKSAACPPRRVWLKSARFYPFRMGLPGSMASKTSRWANGFNLPLIKKGSR